jgi:hypothetical protein
MAHMNMACSEISCMVLLKAIQVSFLYLRARQVYLIESLEHPVAGALNRDKLKGEPVEWHT